MLFRCCVDTLFCCFTDVLFCWPSVLLFCRHIDLRISVGYRGLERQQDFGCCPHSCLAKGWPPSQWWKLNKHTIETAETDRTPQKSPRSITYTAKSHRGSNARKTGNKLILGGSGDRGRWTKDGPGNERHDTQPKHGFSPFHRKHLQKRAGANTTTFSAGKGLHRKRLFLCGNPSGA